MEMMECVSPSVSPFATTKWTEYQQLESDSRLDNERTILPAIEIDSKRTVVSSTFTVGFDVAEVIPTTISTILWHILPLPINWGLQNYILHYVLTF